MRRPELDHFLTTMLDSQPEVSDLLFTVDKPLQVESFGELKPVHARSADRKADAFQTETVALNLIGDNLWHISDLIRRGSCDTAYTLGDTARFRINIFSQRGNYSIVLRKLNTVIPTLDTLKFPAIIKEIPRKKRAWSWSPAPPAPANPPPWPRCSTRSIKPSRSTSSPWKTRSNSCTRTSMATFNQRELGTDFDTFANGLRAALRQAPKVILVGEMRDRETVKIALSAAETGHLVLSTLHTIDAGQTINRILGMFEPEEQEQIRGPPGRYAALGCQPAAGAQSRGRPLRPAGDHGLQSADPGNDPAGRIRRKELLRNYRSQPAFRLAHL